MCCEGPVFLAPTSAGPSVKRQVQVDATIQVLCNSCTSFTEVLDKALWIKAGLQLINKPILQLSHDVIWLKAKYDHRTGSQWEMFAFWTFVKAPIWVHRCQSHITCAQLLCGNTVDVHDIASDVQNISGTHLQRQACSLATLNVLFVVLNVDACT